jgi:ketosteroid isomerase-like protein
MSEENVELVRRSIEAFNTYFTEGTDPIPRLRQFCDPEIEIDFSRRPVDAETYRGYEGAARFAEQLREPWDDFRINPKEFLDAGEKVAIFSQMVGRASQSGITVDAPVSHVCTVRDGRVVRLEYFGDDRAGCLRAAGLSE